MTTEQTPNDAAARAELITHAHRATVEALQTYALGLKGLDAMDVARLLIGASGTVVASVMDTTIAAQLLRELADRFHVDVDPRELN